MTVALFAVDAVDLTAAETLLLGKLRQQLEMARIANAKKYTLYEGNHKARNLDIAVPPHLADVEIHVGAPGIVVDVLAERIEWDDWTTTGTDLLGLDAIYRDNELEVEQARQTVDSLICGVSFVTVGTGNPAAWEPEVLITAESPMNATVLWDNRSRRAVAGLVQKRDPVTTLVASETLYLPDSTVTLTRGTDVTSVTVSRDPHGLGVVPMVPFVNRERPSDTRGRSEITPPVRYYTEAIGRSLLGMEIHREIFTAPNRYGLGVDPKAFGLDPDTPRGARIVKQWDVAMSKMNFIPGPKNPGDQMPVVGQFPSSPPTPYIDQIKHYLQHLSAESSVPWNYWGFATENPPSADAVRVLESRLVKRALLRQRMWTRAWRQVAFLALLHKTPGIKFAQVADISPNWKDPATPTPGAAADSVSKLVGSKILPETSKVTMRRAGISEAEIAEVERDRRAGATSSLVDKLTRPAVPPAPDNAVDQVDGGSGS